MIITVYSVFKALCMPAKVVLFKAHLTLQLKFKMKRNILQNHKNKVIKVKVIINPIDLIMDLNFSN